MWRRDTLHCQQQLGEISCPRMHTSGTFFAVMEKYDFSHQEHQRLKEHGPKLIDHSRSRLVYCLHKVLYIWCLTTIIRGPPSI